MQLRVSALKTVFFVVACLLGSLTYSGFAQGPQIKRAIAIGTSYHEAYPPSMITTRSNDLVVLTRSEKDTAGQRIITLLLTRLNKHHQILVPSHIFPHRKTCSLPPKGQVKGVFIYRVTTVQFIISVSTLLLSNGSS